MVEDCKCVMSKLEGQDDLIVVLRHLVQALTAKESFNDDERTVLAEIGAQLSEIAMTEHLTAVRQVEGVSYFQERLNVVEIKIRNWEADQSMIWECGEEEVTSYLQTVYETREIIAILEKQPVGDGDDGHGELLSRGHDILQIAMVWLEDEFKHMLASNRLPFEPEVFSFQSSEDEINVDDSFNNSFEEDLSREVSQKVNSGRCSEEYSIELVNPDVIPDLRCIADLMVSSKYDHECTQAYISLRKEALEECLFNLQVEKLSIEDVLKMDWNSLSSKINRWILAVKVFVRHYLTREKCLSEQIFGDTVSTNCFLESSKLSILQLLNFGDAIAIGPHQPEKLCKVLDMYEVLADLAPEIDSLFAAEGGSSVRAESHEVLVRLGDCVRATAIEFENAIATNLSTTPFGGGGIHHLTKYVMNYITLLIDYSKILNLLLKDYGCEDTDPVLPEIIPTTEEDNEVGARSTSLPIAIYFRSVTCVLERNLIDKSFLYKDSSLQHFFMMNNIQYMAQKVMKSELRSHFGDEWIRKHNGKVQQEAMNYERASWSPILALLKDDGLYHSGSRSISKTLLKERFRTFNLAFEDIYKAQIAWVVSDQQLRDDLRISTSLKVIQPYRNFRGRHENVISEKYIKYHAEDLQELIMDLFEGSQKPLHSTHRR